ncbi:MAG: CcoQ/FixQ family Cbb3-type cytochrome c oxidase assembly chaperone [Oceanospirillaceae bacterium]|nr:CcoQ/FixQ family Cbb3-type cytochrome c oxidase assembly chaperone [Oceanospirillaceae bacterium]HCI01598.1 CcoQ/FixQ family Cbb3-type cytochrome c oxidase assembly chaperone [Oceanospirillaceae bacterium]|tara:strand:+ start:242 stop:418 length:177 start_codon:yes stop_codon:yes gene_type:complete
MSYDSYGPYIVVIMLITFIGLYAWVLSPKRTKGFNEAANLPFADEEKAKEKNGDIKHD